MKHQHINQPKSGSSNGLKLQELRAKITTNKKPPLNIQ